MDFSEFWNGYRDWKYPLTIAVCLAIGFFAGWFERKQKEARERKYEAVRTATTIGERNEYKK